VILGALKYIQLYMTLDIDQIPVELSQQQKDRIIVLIGEKVDETDCSNC